MTTLQIIEIALISISSWEIIKFIIRKLVVVEIQITKYDEDEKK